MRIKHLFVRSVCISLCVLTYFAGVYHARAAGEAWAENKGVQAHNWALVDTSADGKTVLAAQPYSSFLYLSKDAGATWKPIDKNLAKWPLTRNWAALSVSDNGKVLHALESGQAGGGYLFFSTDGGDTWTNNFTYTSNGQPGKDTVSWVKTPVMSVSGNGLKVAIADDGSFVFDRYMLLDGKIYYAYDGERRIIGEATPAQMATLVKGQDIYTSTDGGRTVNKTASGKFYWKGIASSRDGMKLAAIENGRVEGGGFSVGGYVHTSPDGGDTWQKQTASGKRIWSSVSYSDDGSKILATEKNGSLFTSADGGKTWTQQKNAGVRSWKATALSQDGMKIVALVGDGEKYATLAGPAYCQGCITPIEDEGGYIYLSTDGGVTWIEKKSLGKRMWRSVSISDDGKQIFAVDTQGVFMSNDAGGTWEEVRVTGSHAWMTGATSADGQKFLAADNRGYIYVSSDAGATLVARPQASHPWGVRYGQNFVSSASSADGKRLYVAGDGEILSISTDGGTTWSARRISYGTTAAEAVGRIDSVAASADGMTVIVGTPAQYIFVSRDGGSTFTRMAPKVPTAHGSYIMQVALSGDGSTLIAYSTVSGFLLRSYDYGKTWTELIAAGKREWATVDLSYDGKKIVAGALRGPSGIPGDSLQASEDGGNTWTEQKASPKLWWSSVSVSDDGLKILASGWDAGNQQNFIQLSNDGGITWIPQTDAGKGFWISAPLSADGKKMFALDRKQNADIEQRKFGYLYRATNSMVTGTTSTAVNGVLSLVPCTPGLGRSVVNPKNAAICDQTISWTTTGASNSKVVITGAAPYTSVSFPTGYVAGTGASGTSTFWVTTGTYKASLYSGATKIAEKPFSISGGNVATSTVPSTPATTTATCSTARLTVGQSLTLGQTLRSCNGAYTATLGSDGNLSLGSWSSGTDGKGVARLAMQTDGNLVMHTASRKAVWSLLEYVGGRIGSGQYLELKNDGTLAVYNTSGAVRWSTTMTKKSVVTPVPVPTSTPCTSHKLFSGNTLTPGQTLRSCNGAHTATFTADGNFTFGGWSSNTGGQGGAKLTMQTDGNLVIYTAGRKALWSLLNYQGGKMGAGQYLELKDDGTLAVYNAAGAVRWSTTMPLKPLTPTGSISAITPCVPGLGKSTTDPANAAICDQTVSWSTANASDVKMVITGDAPYATASFPSGYTAGTGANNSGTFWVTAGTYKATIYSGATKLDEESFTITVPATSYLGTLNQMASVLKGLEELVKGWR